MTEELRHPIDVVLPGQQLHPLDEGWTPLATFALINCQFRDEGWPGSARLSSRLLPGQEAISTGYYRTLKSLAQAVVPTDQHRRLLVQAATSTGTSRPVLKPPVTRHAAHMTTNGDGTAGHDGPLIRAGDDEREVVVVQLKEHHAAGRLSTSEFEDRVTQTLVAAHVRDLADVLQDLPPAPTAQHPSNRPVEYVRFPRRAGKLVAIGIGALVAATCLNFASQAMAAPPGPPACAETMKPPTSSDGSCPAPEHKAFLP